MASNTATLQHATLQHDPPLSGRFKIAAAAFCVLGVTFLVANARTMNIDTDESAGFYLCQRPLVELLGMLRANAGEDPPLWDVILSQWIPVAGYRLFLLRCLPLFFWLLMMPGLFLATRRLAGRRAAWFALVAACWMPYHWTIPAAFRWYSLFACLVVWNFWCFLRMMERARESDEAPPPSRRSRLYRAIPYTLTGACLWYTNYAAPVFFFVHLVVAVVRADRRRQVVTDLAFSWLAILLLFSPWLPTFFRQLGTSVRARSFAHMGLSLYVLFAGELSTPFDFWISLPAAAACVLLAVLVVAQWRRCWIPLVTCTVAVLALLQTGAIGPKRLLLVSPFLAITLGIVLGNTALGNTSHGRRRLKAVRVGLVLLAAIVSAGSAVNLTRQSGWIAYRWLDPCEAVVRRIQSRAPQSLIISNSNPVFFFLQDQYGKNGCRAAQEEDAGYRPQAILFRLEANYGPFCERMLAEAETAVWVYHSPYHGPISKWYDDMVRQMHGFGFRVAKTESFLRASPEFLRFHPKFRDRSADPLDEHRIVTVYFVKSAPGEPPTSPRIARSPR